MFLKNSAILLNYLTFIGEHKYFNKNKIIDFH